MTTEIELQAEEGLDLASLEHGKIGMRLGRYLDIYVDEHKLGLVFNAQTTFRMVGMPPTRYPDLSFVSTERLPSDLRVEANFAPDLAVEILSKSDTQFDVEEKVLQYLQSGVRLVWVVRPVVQAVDVYRSGAHYPDIIGIDGELDGEEVIPGFKLKVSALF